MGSRIGKFRFTRLEYSRISSMTVLQRADLVPIHASNHILRKCEDDVESPIKKLRSLKVKYAADMWSMGLILYEMIYCRCPFDSIMETHGHRAMFYIADSRMSIQFPDCPRLHSVVSAVTKMLGRELHNVRQLDCKPQFLHVVTVLQGCLDRTPETRWEATTVQQEMKKLPAVVALPPTAGSPPTSRAVSPQTSSNTHGESQRVPAQDNHADSDIIAKSDSVYGRRYTFLSTNVSSGKMLRTPGVVLAQADAEATVFLDTQIESPQERKQKELLEHMEQFLEQRGGGQDELLQAWKERLAMLESSSQH